MEMQLTELQAKAYDIAVKPTKKLSYIKGYAGAGKSTVLSEAARELGDNCDVLSPTNKAAQVLREKGIGKARTIHSALYSPIEVVIHKQDKEGNIEFMKDASGSYIFDGEGARIPIILDRQVKFDIRQKSDDEKTPAIALVDEGSMIKPIEVEDLMKVYDHIVFFGDGFQLPPVKAEDTFFKSQADVFLDQVHRVALDNPIIRYATSIREGKELTKPEIHCHEVGFCESTHPRLYQSLNENNAQSICWTNDLRHKINDKIREVKGYQKNKLYNGEKIISLSNVREGQRGDKRIKFFNGELLYVLDDYERTTDDYTAMFVKTASGKGNLMWPFWNENFFKTRESPEWEQEVEMRHRTGQLMGFGKDFDYAYCLTAHKAQGSEFDIVAVFDQRNRMAKAMSGDMRQRWFYTAVTRAKKRVLVIK